MTNERNAAVSSRLKRAELASSLGVGLVGFALGMWAARFAIDLAFPALGAGVLIHARGMYDKHVIDRRHGRPEAPWMKVLYWLCWLILAGLSAALLYRLFY